MTDDNWLDRLSLAVADGEDVAAGDVPSGTAEQLRRLASLRNIFRSRAAGAEASEPVCPFRWGRLEVLEMVGRGSFGRVYRARDPVLDRDVALKLFRADSDRDPAQLIDEARRHARIHHPRVLTIHGADIEDGVAGLWTDLLTGQTLADHVRTSGPITGAALRGLARDLVHGLEAVHEGGIVHGDIKPANVWVDPRGRALLMDFGASTPDDASEPVRYGSPATMAPELFAADAATGASDLYALGAVLHFAAVGRYPIEGDSVRALRDAHVSGARPSLAALRPHTGRPLAGLIGDLLARDPAARPSLPEVMQRLDRIEHAPARRFKRGAIAAIILLLLAGLGTALALLDRTRKALVSAEQARVEAQTAKDFLVESVRRMSPVSVEEGLHDSRDILEFLAEFGDEHLQETPFALGELKVVVGARLSHFGETDRGLALAAAGIDQMRRIDPNAAERLAQAIYELAVEERRIDRFDAARRHGEEALALLAPLPVTPERRYFATQIRSMLVGVLYDVGRWHESLAAQEAQMADRAALVGEDDPRMAVEYFGLASPLVALGRYEEALDAYQRALALLEAGATPRPYPTALVTESIAYVLGYLGRFDETRQWSNRARRAYEELGMEPGSQPYLSLDSLEASMLRKEGKATEAVAIYRRLVDGSMPPGQHRATRIGLGLSLLEVGEPAQALEQFQLADELSTPEGHPFKRFLDAAIAYAEHAAGNGSQSRQTIADTVEYFTSHGYDGHQYFREMRRWAEELGVPIR